MPHLPLILAIIAGLLVAGGRLGATLASGDRWVRPARVGWVLVLVRRGAG